MHVILLKAHYSWLHFKQEKLESQIFFKTELTKKKPLKKMYPPYIMQCNFSKQRVAL